MSLNGVNNPGSENSDINGKAPLRDPPAARAGQSLVNVQPARLSDLQPRYAAVIKHGDDNPDAHGWYAQLSE